MPHEVTVNLSDDHLASLTVTNNPLSALAELIWNGLDANARHITIRFDKNSLDTIEAIHVQDTGDGINYDHAESLFGKLGDSWKKTRNRTTSGRGLHGKSGKGRFRAFSLGQHVTWRTTAKRETNNEFLDYKITGKSESIRIFSISDPIKTNGTNTKSGTEVTITNLHKEFGTLTSPNAATRAACLFAGYLAQYPDVIIDYDGTTLDPKTVQTAETQLECETVTLSSGLAVKPRLRIIEWKTPVERTLHLCDETGVSRHDMKLGTAVRAKGMDFTAYLLCEEINQLDQQNRLILEEEDPDVKALVAIARKSIRAWIRKREAEDLSKTVERWKEEKIYPYENKETLSPLEEAERQVFDIIAVNVQEYLPNFEENKTASRRFTFHLLAQALKDNPESLQQIIGQVLGLKKEDQDDLAELLQKTSLPDIIKAAKIVTTRLDFLTGLHNLIFDKETKKILLERDQLHRILEKETWIFDEDFQLAGSEEPLEEVLDKHLHELGQREDDSPVEVGEGKTGRIDLRLQKVLQPRTGEYDYLVVELKRPSQKINGTVLNQIKSYARAIAGDERFHEIPARWKFIVVSNEMDDLAKAEANQPGRPHGVVFEAQSIQVWAKTWSEIINDARVRLRFFEQQLAYEATRDNAKGYLAKAHAKFLPKTDTAIPTETAKNTSDIATKQLDVPASTTTQKIAP